MTASPDLVESESEVFDCDTCEHKRQLDGLDADNVEAWGFYARLLAHRWVWDWQVGPWRLDQLTRDLDEDRRELLLARVSVIYDTFHPPKS